MKYQSFRVKIRKKIKAVRVFEISNRSQLISSWSIHVPSYILIFDILKYSILAENSVSITSLGPHSTNTNANGSETHISIQQYWYSYAANERFQHDAGAVSLYISSLSTVIHFENRYAPIFVKCNESTNA